MKRKLLKTMFCLGTSVTMLINSTFCYAETAETSNEVQTASETQEDLTATISASEKNYLDLLKDKYNNEFTNSILNACKEFKMVCTKKILTVNSGDEKWNYAMTNSEPQDNNSAPKEKVKVAIIDSGVNFSDDVDVYERKNFIPEDEEFLNEDMSVLYEDFSGHGTGVAGIIAAKDNGTGISGIDPNVELYSARVLDNEKNAPISRVVEAIGWAIQKKVNIINISFTTTTDSKELRDVIEKAYNAGILLIASAGNDKAVEYPAAYKEVMAVGSVDSKGEISDFSPSGGETEIVAPGELITSTDVFDTLSTHSGTSLAAPHVTGIAARLWEKDLKCSKDFIRCILDVSANLYGKQDKYGYGLVDMEYADRVYNVLKPLSKYDIVFEKLMKYAVCIKGLKNTTPVATDGSVDSVEGAWKIDEHQKKIIPNDFLNSVTRNIVMVGCVLQDRNDISGLADMYLYPHFHGFMYHQIDHDKETKGPKTDANYLGAYIYLTQIASAFCKSEVAIPDCPITVSKKVNTKYPKDSNVEWTIVEHPNSMDGVIKSDTLNGRSWSSIANKIKSLPANLSNCSANLDPNNSYQKGLLVYGMALHQATDIFAHSAMLPNGDRIYHENKNTKPNDPAADNPDNTNPANGNRYKAASQVAKKLINNHISKLESGSLSDFDLGTTKWNQYFYLCNFNKYAKQVCRDKGLGSNQYSNNFNNLSSPN